jgi:hypothetical protein
MADVTTLWDGELVCTFAVPPNTLSQRQESLLNDNPVAAQDLNEGIPIKQSTAAAGDGYVTQDPVGWEPLFIPPPSNLSFAERVFYYAPLQSTFAAIFLVSSFLFAWIFGVWRIVLVGLVIKSILFFGRINFVLHNNARDFCSRLMDTTTFDSCTCQNVLIRRRRPISGSRCIALRTAVPLCFKGWTFDKWRVGSWQFCSERVMVPKNVI